MSNRSEAASLVAAVAIGSARAVGVSLLDQAKAHEENNPPACAVAEFVGRTWINYAEIMQRVIDGELGNG